MKTAGLLAALALATLIFGCAKNKRVSLPRPPAIGTIETGLASWYGNPYHGRLAASGEIYDMEKLTAAHRTLPFGTWVMVTNLANDKQVNVRISDRGPFVEGRIIDLSRAAARAIDLLGPGIAKVRLEIVSTPAGAGREIFAVQAGAFKDQSSAEQLRETLAERFHAARVVLGERNPPVWRVLVGEETSVNAANAIRDRLRAEQMEAFVVRVDEQPPQLTP